MNTRLLQAVQRKVGARPDGVFGDQTLSRIAEHLGVEAPAPDPITEVNRWPRDTFHEMEAFFGPHGDTDLHLAITPPYQLYFDGRPISKITVHRKIAAAVLHVLDAVRREYGPEIHELQLDVFDGCFNDRAKRGGTSWSTHAYAAALDFCAARNALRMDHTEALFARPEYEPWWKLWESVGAVSLGRERDFDWMHVQFARL